MEGKYRRREEEGRVLKRVRNRNTKSINPILLKDLCMYICLHTHTYIYNINLSFKRRSIY